jgi:D-hydroxyproline dehydrogenase subunit gamma
MSRIVVDGRPVEFEPGDSIAVAIVRAGEHPYHGGCLCLAGDCPNCVAVVDGIGYVRTCQTQARPGTVVQRHPAVGGPSLFTEPPGDAPTIRHAGADVVVVGAGESGSAARARYEQAGRRVLVLDARDGNEVVGIYAGPTVIARAPGAMLHVHAHEVAVATGAAELHPVCPGNRLQGIVTRRAAGQLRDAGVDLGRVVAVGEPLPGVECIVAAGTLVRFDGVDSAGVPSGDAGGGRIAAVVMRDASGAERTYPCDTAAIGLGSTRRDVLARAGRATVGESALHEIEPSRDVWGRAPESPWTTSTACGGAASRSSNW